MAVRVFQTQAGGQDVLVEDPAACESLVFDTEPCPIELDPAAVFQFSQDLARLAKGVTGVALVGSNCIPIVTPEYFRTDRAPAYGIRTIDRTAQATGVPPAGARHFFVFGVPGAKGFQFALSMTQVLEVSRAVPMAPLNFEHSHFAGVSVWRGETIPLIDLALAARLGSIAQEAWVRMLVVRNRANRVFAIATVGQVRQPAAASQVFAPESVSVRPMRGIRGVFRFEGSPLLVPDLDALID